MAEEEAVVHEAGLEIVGMAREDVGEKVAIRGKSAAELNPELAVEKSEGIAARGALVCDMAEAVRR